VTEKKLFINPSSLEYSITIGFWSILLVLSNPGLFISLISSSLFTKVYGDGNPFANVIFGFLTVNFGLTAVVAYMGVDADIPFQDLIKWLVLTPFFGFTVVQPFVKICYRRKQELEADDPIG
jgi:hypothetical protein